MLTIEQTVDIPADRHLHLDMALPKSVPGGRTRVVLAFSPADAAESPAPETHAGVYTPEPFPSIEELKAEAAAHYAEMQRTGVDPLARFAGCLKDVFPEDGLEYQRKIRDEWPD
ncbi:MAG: hypothetical protein LBP37_06615 [Spirochaetaceae bacterium]|jgi:hypothetical protein|nr:hypothetical protein [Spirochaetaceae bacterium]